MAYQRNAGKLLLDLKQMFMRKLDIHACFLCLHAVTPIQNQVSRESTDLERPLEPLRPRSSLRG